MKIPQTKQQVIARHFFEDIKALPYEFQQEVLTSLRVLMIENLRNTAQLNESRAFMAKEAIKELESAF